MTYHLSKRETNVYLNQGSLFVFVITFQVISRFCPGPKGHSPGYSTGNLAQKGRHQRHSKLTAVQNLEKVVSI